MKRTIRRIEERDTSALNEFRRDSRNSVALDEPHEVFAEETPIAPHEQTAINPGMVFHAIRRNWLLGLLLGCLIGPALAAIPLLLIKLEYKVSALVRISPQHVTLMFETADRSPATRGDFRSFKNTQRQLILAPNLLNSALKKEGVSELTEIRSQTDPISWLQKELEIKFPDDSEIMEISLSLHDGKAAKKIVDSVVATYYEEVVLTEQDERMKRASNLERVYAEAENKARQKRAELQNAADLQGGGDSATLNLAQQAAMQQYSLIRSELTKVQFDLMKAEGEAQHRQSRQKDQANSSDAQSIDLGLDSRVGQILADDPVGAQAARDVERLSKLIEQAQKRLASGATSSYIEKYRVQLEEAKRKVEERLQVVQAGSVLANDGKGGTGNIVTTDLSRAIEILKDQERRLQDELKRQESDAKKFGRSSVEVEMLRSEVESLDKVVARVADELERTKIELKSSSRITLLGAAQIPQNGNSKFRIPLTVLVALLGLFGPLALLSAIDVGRRHVNGRKSVTDLMLMPVLGSVPLVPKSTFRLTDKTSNASVEEWRRRLTESISSITSMLLHRLEFEGHRVVLITSAMPGEGKSTLSNNLAHSIANSGHRTLLIDLDLRRPVLHRRLNLPLEPGVTDVLRKNAPLLRTVHQAYDCPNLTIMTAGAFSGTLLPDASNGSLESLIEEARANFEIVIIDTPPLLPVTDGRLIGQYADGAILSVIKDVSRLPGLCEAYRILGEYGVQVLGCVVTGLGVDNEYYGYGYK